MRILLAQRSLSPPGGGNAVAAWMLHALGGEHDLATVTLRDWLPERTNAFYGTSIPATIRRHLTPWPWSQLGSLPVDHGRHLTMSAVLRSARRLTRDFDVPITADNFGPFTKPGIQYVHYPIAPQPSSSQFLVRSYFRFSDRITGVPWQQARRNLTLANSSWTAAGLEREHGIGATVLYPPVIDPGAGRPWELRTNSFLCVGRFHGSKRIEVAMAILRRLRTQAMPDARLIIVGSPVDAEYAGRIRRLSARDRDWIEFREDLSRAAINQLIGECRYGLQPMIDEHFGMATAEMARGGCLVFAHDSAGSREVLANDPALLWRSEDEAVARIGDVAGDMSRRDGLRDRLRRHTERFSPERFVRDFRAIVNDFR